MNNKIVYRLLAYLFIIVSLLVFSLASYSEFVSMYNITMSHPIAMMIFLSTLLFSLLLIGFLYSVSKVRLYRVLHDRAIIVFKIMSYIMILLSFLVSGSFLIISLTTLYQVPITVVFIKEILLKVLLYATISLIWIISISIRIGNNNESRTSIK